MFEGFSILSWLKSHGILPGAINSTNSNNLYNLTDIHKAIESYTKTKVNLNCKKVNKSISHEPILTGIIFCYDPKLPSIKPANCKYINDGACGRGKVRFITFNGHM